MRALTVHEDAAHRLGFAEVGEPVPGPDEVVVDVGAFSVNRGELSLIRTRPSGWRPGQDVVGTVRSTAAGGTGPGVGTRVVGLVEEGGWAERVAVRTDRLAVLPATVADATAATLPIAGLTALRTLRLEGDPSGSRVLVTGASGAVGRFQVELGAVAGAEVTAVARPEQADVLRGLGAGTVVPHPREAPGRFDLVLESVGGDSLAGSIERVAPGGTVVLLGNSSGEPTPVSLYDFLGREGAALRTFFSYSVPGPPAPELAELVDLVARGLLRPTVARDAGWAGFGDALDALAGRTLHGKVVLHVD